ncbi:MAG: hypothetical protein DCF24_06375 [Cyanobium sp.]|nr:MAG: hypothetical protein DCF24_06375 [Cyanobium sp.]
MLNGEIFEEVIWGFQLQQSVEKAFKAWLYLLDQDVPFTHNLTLLLQLLQDSGLDVTAFLPLETFTDVAVQLRYDEAATPLLNGPGRSGGDRTGLCGGEAGAPWRRHGRS